MLTVAEQSFTSIAGDWIALLTGACALAAIVWGAVLRATKPLRDDVGDWRLSGYLADVQGCCVTADTEVST